MSKIHSYIYTNEHVILHQTTQTETNEYVIFHQTTQTETNEHVIFHQPHKQKPMNM